MSSSQNFSYSYSSSSSFSSSSTSNGQTTGSHHSQHTVTDPSGTKVKTVSGDIGGPTYEDSRSYDSQGHELLEGSDSSSAGRNQPRIQDVEVEDVTDADEQYKEKMEDEYAKREGGA
ncbi:hypothetical protein MBLNU457_6004t1 [Dothideomycetes sp. NU457]